MIAVRYEMKWMPIVFLTFFFSGCASLQERIAQQIEYVIPKDAAAPGEVFQIGYILPEEVRGGYVRFLGKKYRVFPRKDLGKRTFMSFLPIPKVKPGKYRILCYFFVEKEKPPVEEKLFVQILPDFMEHLVDKVRGRRFKVKEYVKDRTRIQSLLSHSVYKPQKMQDFILPVGGEVVSTFGTIRKYGEKVEVALEGIEIASISASVMDVNAAADGKVLLAEKLHMLGNTVLIDHGFSFATLYCHLKNLEVKAGQVVLRGDRLGLIGNTGGAAKGRCLYYQLFVAGTPVDVQNYSSIDIFE